MGDVIICVGISGSGKSTFSANFIKENSSYLRINRDDIRTTLVGNLNGYYKRRDLNSIEILVNQIEQSLAVKIINNAQRNLIIDNTNLKQSYIKKWMHEFDEIKDYSETDIKFKLFDCSLEEARGRVWYRENMFANSPDDCGFMNFKELDYINKQYKDYQLIKEWLIKNYKDKIIDNG